MSLGELLTQPTLPEPKGRVIAAHARKPATRRKDDETVPFFDETRVPVEVIEPPAPETDGISANDYEVITHKEGHRRAQRPGSYVVIKYRRPVVKLKASEALVCTAAPAGIIDGSRANVSFIAGLLIDKFADHLPLYRQHQRLTDAGITVTRPWLTQVAQQGAALLEPNYEAQFASIRESRVKAMDETPTKAGQAVPGQLKKACFWPVYGELDEICFPFFASREIKHVEAALGLNPAERAVLLSNGYRAYAHYVAGTGITRAPCWAPTRRGFFEAQTVEPEAALQALALIGDLYRVEEHIRPKNSAVRASRTITWSTRSRSSSASLPGRANASQRRDCSPAIRWPRRLPLPATDKAGWTNFSPTRTCRSTPTTSNEPGGRFRWGVAIGCSAAPSWGPGTSASFRA